VSCLGLVKGTAGGSRLKCVVPAVVLRCALQAISISAGSRPLNTLELNLLVMPTIIQVETAHAQRSAHV